MDPGTMILGASMVSDFFGGLSAKKKQEKRFREFQQSVAKREREQIALERIARGEIQTSLAESKHLFNLTLGAISASGSMESRRFLEDLARREAVANVQARQRGMQGSTATAAAALANEREMFRGAMDAEANRSARMGQVFQQQIGVNAGLRGDLANSYRQEGRIRDEAGAKMQRALENTQVNYNPNTPGVAQLLAQLGLIGPSGKPKEMIAGSAPTEMGGPGLPSATLPNGRRYDPYADFGGGVA